MAAVQAVRAPEKPQLSAEELLENAKEQARVRPEGTLSPPIPRQAEAWTSEAAGFTLLVRTLWNTTCAL